MKELKLFDTVAILRDVPDQHVVYGQVGTIVEILGNHVYEVEFTTSQGETIAEFAVNHTDLLLLHHEMAAH